MFLPVLCLLVASLGCGFCRFLIMNLTCTCLVFRKFELVTIQKLNVNSSSKSTMLFGAEGQRDVT